MRVKYNDCIEETNKIWLTGSIIAWEIKNNTMFAIYKSPESAKLNFDEHSENEVIDLSNATSIVPAWV